MKRVKVVLAAMAALFIIGNVSAQTADDVAKQFNAAAELINTKQWDKAIPALEGVVAEGLKVGPDATATVKEAQKLLPTCYFYNAMNAAKGGQMETAAAGLAKAAEMGELYGDINTANNAKRMISQVYTAMGAAAFNAKEYAKAAEIFAKGYAANPNDTKLGLNLAKSYCEMGELVKGEEIYKNIIALESKHSKYKEDADKAKEELVYYMMLNVPKLAEEKKYDEIMKIADDILVVDPANAQAQLLRLQTATNMKDFDKVISLGEGAAEAQTDPALKSDAYFLLGAAYQNKENKAKAIELYKKVVAGNNVATAKAQIAVLSK